MTTRAVSAVSRQPLRYFTHNPGVSHIAAGLLLVLMLVLGVASMRGDSATMDELAHIPSGYSYVEYGDYRLNPEHPPLMKDMAGLPLQFMELRFPDDRPVWQEDVNGQWGAGWDFLYHLGNDADAILLWSRLPILLLGVAFGGVMYLYLRRRYGDAVGLLALFFYALSPNILAHTRYVTTDIGATATAFLAIIAFVRFIERPRRDSFLLLSLALALAQLTKFSAVLLYPLLGVISLVLVLTWRRPATRLTRLRTFTGGFIAASALSAVWIWIAYVPHVLGMPNAVQDRLIYGSLYDRTEALKPVLAGLNDIPGFQSLTQYLLGVAMVFNRVDSGNVTYFLGEVSDQSFKLFFPVLFLVKTPIPFLVLLLVSLTFAARRLGGFRALSGTAARWTREHLLEVALGAYAVFYFYLSVAGNLNLGIRHILPIYVPLFVLVALALARLAKRLNGRSLRAFGLSLGLLLGWYAGGTLWIHPHYVAYFNESIGGPANGDKYFSDSSIDWGQDLRRLQEYVEARPEIDRIAIDYFGGADPRYYFCARQRDERGEIIRDESGYDCTASKFVQWSAQQGRYPGQYIAVSETYLQNDRWYARERGDEGYAYLRDMKPVARIGYSIYVYKLY